jgi:hypothetical protein
MASGHRALIPVVLLLVILLLARPAAAQTMPWPGDPPLQGGAPPWPGEGGAPPPGMASPGIPPRTGGGGAPPCMAAFTKLREEVEKKGLAAKAASQKHAAREEMCKLITSYAASEANWVKFTEAGVGTCGIPVQVVNELKQVHANTEGTVEKICAGSARPDHPLTGDFDFWTVRPSPGGHSPDRPRVGDFDFCCKSADSWLGPLSKDHSPGPR